MAINITSTKATVRRLTPYATVLLFAITLGLGVYAIDTGKLSNSMKVPAVKIKAVSADDLSNLHFNTAPAVTPTATEVTVPQTTTATVPSKPRPTITSSAPVSTACINTAIPRGNTYEDDPSLPIGQTETHQGKDGTLITCPGGAGYAGWSNTIPPINNRVYTGTAAPMPAPDPTAGAAPNYNAALSQCSVLGGSAVQVCMSAHGY